MLAKKSGQQGFILIYVVAMVAALTITIFHVSQLRNAVPRQTERQLGRAIEAQEIRQFEEFVTNGLGYHQVPVDPRYLAFRHLQQSDPSRLGDLEDAVAQLKAMLAEYKINVDGRDGKKSSQTPGDKVNDYLHDGNAKLFSPTLKPYTVKLGEREYRVTVWPANAFPNLNSIAYAPLWRYLVHVLKVQQTEAQELAANIIDWRDPDSFRTEGIGAENETYNALGYTARNASLRQWRELAYVKGISAERLRLIRASFFLAPADVTAGVLLDYISPGALAAIADLRPELAQTLFDEFGRRPDSKTEGVNKSSVSSNLETILGDGLARFDQAIAWKMDGRQVRIQIDGPNRSVTLDYEIEGKRVLDRWE